MKSAHNRKFVSSGVALVVGRLRNTLKVRIQNQDEIEALIIESGILKEAPFLWVGLVYLYGTKLNLEVEFERINKRYGDVPVLIELDMEILRWADRHNVKLLKDMFMIGALESLVQICRKYKLEGSRFEEELKKYGKIPESIEECEALYGREEEGP